MGKKDKKKGKGAEKTAMKTEKKALNRIKKELAAKGEDDIEKLIAEFQEQDKIQQFVGEEQCSQPSPRSGFSLCSHPDKEELLLFGGEYFNGSKTLMYNDLFFYNIKKDQWSILKCPLKPPPRCSHQAVTLSHQGGQLWVFGGEFASPSHSNFYHYKDLWVFHIAEKRWEQIKASGTPSSRSGHRMVALKKQLIIFGGFHETVRDYKYFNDVYIFDLDDYKWSKIEPLGKGPCPRSGCQMVALSDNRILLYGGYSKEKVKKEVDKGIAHTDMYYLQLDDRSSPPKWKWVQAKSSGSQPMARSGFSIAAAPNNRAYAFGGVSDQEDEETLTSSFHNDLHLLELDRGHWFPVSLRCKEADADKKRKTLKQPEVKPENVEEDISKIDISEDSNAEPEIKTDEDGVFTVKIGPQSSTEPLAVDEACSSTTEDIKSKSFPPNPRMNAGLVVTHGKLFLYGGIYEEGDRQITLSDFHFLDVHKLDEWHTIVPLSAVGADWLESEDSESSVGENDKDAASGDDDDEDSEDEAPINDEEHEGMVTV